MAEDSASEGRGWRGQRNRALGFSFTTARSAPVYLSSVFSDFCLLNPGP
ncbi:MAG: hypothetical protein LBD06_02005 [Candidatus Accumulibacter sp.]|nr:hypothetical protein [Accumulibacter sp.]